MAGLPEGRLEGELYETRQEPWSGAKMVRQDGKGALCADALGGFHYAPDW